MVSGWFKLIAFTVHFISKLLPLPIWADIAVCGPEAGEACPVELLIHIDSGHGRPGWKHSKPWLASKARKGNSQCQCKSKKKKKKKCNNRLNYRELRCRYSKRITGKEMKMHIISFNARLRDTIDIFFYWMHFWLSRIFVAAPRPSLIVASGSYSFIVCGLSVAVGSLVAEHVFYSMYSQDWWLPGWVAPWHVASS